MISSPALLVPLDITPDIHVTPTSIFYETNQCLLVYNHIHTSDIVPPHVGVSSSDFDPPPPPDTDSETLKSLKTFSV